MLPRVTEMFVSEAPRLSRNMVPKILRSLAITNSYKCNLIFTYDLPTRLTGHHIVDALKDLDYRHCKAYLIDITEQLRSGFISASKSLPDYKFNELIQKLKSVEVEVSSLGKVKINISEVWLQPVNCDPPIPKKSDTGKNVEFILINYIYLHNLSATVQPTDLIVKSPVPFRVHIYHSQDSNTQIGFVSLQDIHESNVGRLICYLRSLIFDNLSVLVDEMWIKECNLPADINERSLVHISRKVTAIVPMRVPDPLPEIIDDKEGGMQKEFGIKLAEEPPASSNLMKSHMIFLMNLPPNLNKSKIVFDMNVPCEGLSLMQTSTEKVAFLYHRQVSEVKWLEVLDKICFTSINDRRIVAKEIYLMSDETVELIKSKYPAVYLSSYVFVYNIGAEGDQSMDEFDQHPFIIRHCFMTTDSATKCAFVQLRDDLSPPQIVEVLHFIRTINIGGKIVWADLIWLANITVVERQPLSTEDPRNAWTKEPPEKRFKE